MRKKIKLLGLIASLSIVILAGCTSKNTNSATQNNKMQGGSNLSQDSSNNSASDQTQDDNANVTSGNTREEIETQYASAIKKDTSVYDVDIAADQETYNGKVDIKVGDHHYATQINDWYMNFNDYAGKVVEIEGFYINEFAPYDFVGRYGPQCPYCQGGYVSFEIMSDENLTEKFNEKDWIKVTGILREGKDQLLGAFCYIEVLNVEKMAKAGLETVVN